MSTTRQKGNWLLFLSSVLICLLVAELFLDWRSRPQMASHPSKPAGWAIVPEASWIEYHPKLGWVQQKNKTSVLKKQNSSISIHTNSEGFRGSKEYSISKENSKIRIYALGDSFTFGFGVEDQESYPAQLETLDPRLEVFNLGVPGYGVDQMLLSLEELHYKHQPNIVLIGIFPEDFWRATRAFTDAGFGKPYFTFYGNQLQLHHVPVPEEKNFQTDQFPEIQQAPFPESLFLRSGLYRLFTHALKAGKKRLQLEDPETGTEWQLGRLLLEKMVNDVKANHAVPVIVIIPPYRWLSGTVEPLRDSLLRLAERTQTPILDLTAIFEEASKTESLEKYYIAEDYHWTAEGNRKVAETMFTYLQNQKLL